MKTPEINLQSSVNVQGKYVTQIIHFVGGVKRTYHGIDTDSIKQGQFTKMKLKDGSMLVVNDVNVLVIEVFPEND
ncbi:hypothetical protein HOE22_02855 [Candidatus Woesearchaeota archaeon]|jgi:hypothetical protein|nr:hypothetical protein [Candidatus Woesearchaeota archaeon]